MREWCLVIKTRSASDAKQIGEALRDLATLDLDVEGGEERVLCFADSEAAIRNLADAVRQTLVEARLWQGPILSGRLLTWSDEQHRYVDPEHPEDRLYGDGGGDLDLDPAEIRCRVRLELTSVLDSRRVREELPGLQGRVIDTGSRHIDLGATDPNDAEEVARAARTVSGVASATPTELGRRERWWLRQRLAGNYAVQPPDGSVSGW